MGHLILFASPYPARPTPQAQVSHRDVLATSDFGVISLYPHTHHTTWALASLARPVLLGSLHAVGAPVNAIQCVRIVPRHVALDTKNPLRVLLQRIDCVWQLYVQPIHQAQMWS